MLQVCQVKKCAPFTLFFYNLGSFDPLYVSLPLGIEIGEQDIFVRGVRLRQTLRFMRLLKNSRQKPNAHLPW